MNTGYWAGAHDLQFPAPFLIKLLRTKEVEHRRGVKIQRVNLKQHKPVLDIRTMGLLDLHKLCRKVECQSPALYCRHVVEDVIWLGGILQHFASPQNSTSHLLCSSVKAPSPKETGEAHVLIWTSWPYSFGNNDAMNQSLLYIHWDH